MRLDRAFDNAVRRGAVVRMSKPDQITYEGSEGKPNAYYRVVAAAIAERGYTFEECLEQKITAEDKDRRELTQRPWNAGDVTALLAKTDTAPRAFRLRVAAA